MLYCLPQTSQVLAKWNTNCPVRELFYVMTEQIQSRLIGISSQRDNIFYIISLSYNLPYSYFKSNIKVLKLYELSSFNTNKNNCGWQTGCLLSFSLLEFHLTGAHASHFLLALVNVSSNKLNTQSQTFKRCHVFCLLWTQGFCRLSL